jgi:putative component of toxin-antitoxin plasmid stabilization module
MDTKVRIAVAVFIHRKSHFTKYLHKLRRAGGRSALAAEQAEAIMATLASAPGMLKPVHRLTKFGERRIDGCHKYDLGAGYRLVYVKEEEHTVFLFVGTHDDCDRWLTNNAYLYDLQLDRLEDDARCVSEPTMVSGAVAPLPKADDEMDYDDILMQKIDEQMLRRIFHALCRDNTSDKI